MPGYTEDDIVQARKPFRDHYDRGHASCVLGHLEVEEREQPNAQRAADMRAISAAVQSYDARHFGHAAATQCSAPTEAAAPPPPIATVVQPFVSPPRATLQPAATLEAPRRPTLGAGRIDLLSAVERGSRSPGTVDIVADMKRRHGIAA